MLPEINKSRLRKFTRHVIIASKKLVEKEEAGELEKKREMPEFLIKRRFPVIPVMPVQIEQPQPRIIQPLPAEEIFELGKITKFAIDKNIDFIECSGPDIPLKVKKETYTFSTDIILKEEEIKDIISKFSAESKVLITPIFRADARGFSITAIISDTGSRFIILRKK